MPKPVNILLFGFFIAAGAVWFVTLVAGNSRFRAEHEHGIALPTSAHNIQCRGDAWHGFLDRGAATMFEMNIEDLNTFVAQLKVNSKRQPLQSTGDPTVNGYNVWPHDCTTAVPGNVHYGGFHRTWHGTSNPVEMLSCSCPKGDWLHVELWKLNDTSMLVKMYTDWN